MSQNIKNVAVIGAGAMGQGIALSVALADLKVTLIDVKQEFIEKGINNIKRMLDSRIKRGQLTENQVQTYLGSINGQTNYQNLENTDFVIEAALEKIEVKLKIFQELDNIIKPEAILASNTSALSISQIACATKRKDKIIGMHFFNPAHIMKLVEVIPGYHTSHQTIATTQSLSSLLGKTAVVVKECPGFLVNRLLFPYMNEAIYALTEGLASINQIDETALQFGLPMGPFTLMDMTGLDICLDVNEFLYNEYGLRFETAKLLKLMVEHGFLGQKSKAGFYLHDNQPNTPKQVNPDFIELLASLKTGNKPCVKFDFNRVILPMFNEAIYAYQEGVVELADIDIAMNYGCGLKRGILSLSTDNGLAWCLEQMGNYHKLYGERFRPSWLLKKMVHAGILNLTKNANSANLSLVK